MNTHKETYNLNRSRDFFAKRPNVVVKSLKGDLKVQEPFQDNN